MLKQIVRFLFIFSVITVLSGCRKSEERVPLVFVDFSLSLYLPEFSNLAAPGGWVEISGGSRGIIIYRRSQDEFVAFDRHCTYKVSEGCRIDVDTETGLTANCPCCNSVFSIFDGIPVSGTATVTLLDYRTGYNANTNILRVFNY
jgi:nitrite reductase/ring-hydroxylating ferredoxin subunit